eukprot:m.142154 g.142154  ORF g.142154 m.142154 type:complete len:217 (-) comp17673_c0_seq3:184-834(-)
MNHRVCDPLLILAILFMCCDEWIGERAWEIFCFVYCRNKQMWVLQTWVPRDSVLNLCVMYPIRELARGMDITAILRGCGPVANLRIRRSEHGSSTPSTRIATPASSLPHRHASEPVAGRTCCRASPRLVELLEVLDQCTRQKREQELQLKKDRMPTSDDIVRWKQHQESAMHRYDGPTTDLVAMTTGLSMSTNDTVRSSREQWMESLTSPWSTSFT